MAAASATGWLLVAATVDVLRLQWGGAWTDTGLVLTAEDGTKLVPDHVSRLFASLLKEADLPPVRLHDLRHDPGPCRRREPQGGVGDARPLHHRDHR